MSTELQKAKDLLFGAEGLGVTNFKLYPGANREATAEQIAAEINGSLEAIMAGDYEVVDLDKE